MQGSQNENAHFMKLKDIEEAENIAAKVLLNLNESHDARRLAVFITLTASRIRRAHAY